MEYTINRDVKNPLAITDDIAAVYSSTYTEPPYNETSKDCERFKNSWPNRVSMKGFRLVTATDMNQKCIGMAYGWKSSVGDDWNQVLRKELGEPADEWLANCFEFVDIAIMPNYRGYGIGKKLISDLFDFSGYETSLLLTHQTVTRAYEMYLKNGWRELKRDFLVTPEKKFIIMGKRLAD